MSSKYFEIDFEIFIHFHRNMSLHLCYDEANLFRSHLAGFSPIELMSLARVCKAFYRVVKKVYPDYGVKANIIEVLLQLGSVHPCDDAMHSKYDDFVEHVVKNDDFFIFGSVLLCAATKPCNTGTLPFRPSDLDIFTTTSRVYSHSSYLREAIPKFSKSLLDTYLGYDTKRSSKYELAIGSFAVFRGILKGVATKLQADIVVGIKDRQQSNITCAWSHICRSQIPMSRIIYSKDGFKCQKLEDFFETQEVYLPKTIQVLTDLQYFVSHTIKFLSKNIRPMKLYIPLNDFEIVATALNQLKVLDQEPAITTGSDNHIVCSW